MNSSINIITALSRVKGDNGIDHFTGSIDLTSLRKTKVGKIEIVLSPVESVPKALASLMKKAGITGSDLLMFAVEDKTK